jgi:hypothetical protein
MPPLVDIYPLAYIYWYISTVLAVVDRFCSLLFVALDSLALGRSDISLLLEIEPLPDSFVVPSLIVQRCPNPMWSVPNTTVGTIAMSGPSSMEEVVDRGTTPI